MLFQFLIVVLLGWVVDWFLIDFWSIWGSKIDQKIHQKSIKKRSEIRCNLECNLEGSWIDFWSILGPTWGPSWGSSWHQNRKKGDAKTMSKKHTKPRGPRAPGSARQRPSRRGGGPYKQFKPPSRPAPLDIRHALRALPFLQGTVADIYIYRYIYIYIYIYVNIRTSLSGCIYIYGGTCPHRNIYIYIYILFNVLDPPRHPRHVPRLLV